MAPVYLLHGEEDYLRDKALTLFWEHAVDPAMTDFNRDSFQAEDVEPASLFALAASFPMMAERRLVVVKHMEKAGSKLQQDLLTYLKDPSPSTCLVLTAGKVDRRTRFWKGMLSTLKQQAVDFKRPGADQLSGWLSRECSTRGRDLDPGAAESLAMGLDGAGLYQAIQEIEKLCLVKAEGEAIGLDDLSAVSGMEPGGKPFDLEKAVQRRDTKSSLRILGRLLRQADAGFVILPILIRSFGRLWFIRCLLDSGLSVESAASSLKLNAWWVNNTLRNARSWNRSQLEEACLLLREADAGSKGGSALNLAQLLSKLVVELCRIP